MFNIVYGAITGIAQRDLKFLIGFSSVSHMGMVLFGIATLTFPGFTGASFEMFAHGFMTALFFASVELFYFLWLFNWWMPGRNTVSFSFFSQRQTLV